MYTGAVTKAMNTMKNDIVILEQKEMTKTVMGDGTGKRAKMSVAGEQAREGDIALSSQR